MVVPPKVDGEKVSDCESRSRAAQDHSKELLEQLRQALKRLSVGTRLNTGID